MDLLLGRNFRRLFNYTNCSRIFMNEIATVQTPLFLHLSPSLYAEPLKKKKRLDPAIVKQREERKKKRLEKQIRRLEKNARQYKPIEECQVPLELINDAEKRARVQISTPKEELIRRSKIIYEWSLYKTKQRLSDYKMIDRVLLSQQWALDQLKLESPELYRAAIQFDENLLPFIHKGPVETPPITNYDSPDGEYVDTSKKWE